VKTNKVTAPANRPDHESVYFKGKFIPVLGTVGGTREESEQTAKNIERFFEAPKSARIDAIGRKLKRRIARVMKAKGIQ
jgi:hypothetical protein